MANKLQITEEQNREMIKLMDDLNDRLEEKEHTIEALKSQAKSVSSLMKEIKRLEKIAGRKSYNSGRIIKNLAGNPSSPSEGII